MNKITVDTATQDQLEKLRSFVQVCDPAGRVLGYFTPQCDPALYAGVESPECDEELSGRAAEGGGRGLTEILGELTQGTHEIFRSLGDQGRV